MIKLSIVLLFLPEIEKIKADSGSIDEVIEQELQQISCNPVRTPARLANEKIHESSVNSLKRKASEELIKDVVFFSPTIEVLFH